MLCRLCTVCRVFIRHGVIMDDGVGAMLTLLCNVVYRDNENEMERERVISVLTQCGVPP